MGRGIMGGWILVIIILVMNFSFFQNERGETEIESQKYVELGIAKTKVLNASKSNETLVELKKLPMKLYSDTGSLIPMEELFFKDIKMSKENLNRLVIYFESLPKIVNYNKYEEYYGLIKEIYKEEIETKNQTIARDFLHKTSAKDIK